MHANGQLQYGGALGPKVVLYKVAIRLEATSRGVPERSMQSREQAKKGTVSGMQAAPQTCQCVRQAVGLRL